MVEQQTKQHELLHDSKNLKYPVNLLQTILLLK